MVKRWKMGESAIQSLASEESAWRRSNSSHSSITNGSTRRRPRCSRYTAL